MLFFCSLSSRTSAMPTYRSITTSLVSQFDILNLPEFSPPSIPSDPFANAPTLISPDHSLISIYVPIYPSSQFWLRYSISPPYPPRALFYFKLYVNGKCIVSWGCGEGLYSFDPFTSVPLNPPITQLSGSFFFGNASHHCLRHRKGAIC